MLPAVLGTAAGAAAVTAGRGAAAALGNGLSFVAELAKCAGGPAEASQQEPHSSLASELQQRMANLTERIRRQLAAAGISLSQPVEIFSDELGRLAVAGSHPQKGTIEQALSNDVLLERDFKRLAADYAAAGEQSFAVQLPAASSISVATTTDSLMTRK